jgi:hypothetical protein
MPILCLLLGLLVPRLARAYPEFIGYKYSTCLTCHYNGQGNGPLNEYGRALFATEISSRKFAGSKSDEQLGEDSGFLKSKFPDWLKPGIKARNLVYRPNPGGQGESRYILMQAELNAAVLFDQDQKFIFVGSFGHAPVPNRLKGQSQANDTSEWISREHYFRWMYSEKMWVYAGMMDKVYGLRIVNHTAYSRARTGLAQNDQTHGLMFHYINPQWEWSHHLYAGNLYQDSDLRQIGYSTMLEYEVAEAWRLGISGMFQGNKYVDNRRFGLHTKTGLGYGSSLLMEVGLINDIPKKGDAKLGYYLFSEAQQRVFRGYHSFVSGQMFKDDMKQGRADVLKASFGMLAFPGFRSEFRVELENTRQLSPAANVPKETWGLLAQIHLSL